MYKYANGLSHLFAMLLLPHDLLMNEHIRRYYRLCHGRPCKRELPRHSFQNIRYMRASDLLHLNSTRLPMNEYDDHIRKYYIYYLGCHRIRVLFDL